MTQIPTNNIFLVEQIVEQSDPRQPSLIWEKGRYYTIYGFIFFINQAFPGFDME